MVLTILYNFVTISNEFCINLCVHIEEYVHFYRFCCEEKPTHIVSTYLSGLYTELVSPGTLRGALGRIQRGQYNKVQVLKRESTSF